MVSTWTMPFHRHNHECPIFPAPCFSFAEAMWLGMLLPAWFGGRHGAHPRGPHPDIPPSLHCSSMTNILTFAGLAHPWDGKTRRHMQLLFRRTLTGFQTNKKLTIKEFKRLISWMLLTAYMSRKLSLRPRKLTVKSPGCSLWTCEQWCFLPFFLKLVFWPHATSINFPVNLRIES
jgi:hypothetical protein